jgi:hypothetical protein
MPTLTLKPQHKVVSAYYDNLAKFAKLGIEHETAVRSAFQELLEHCARQFDWKLVPEFRRPHHFSFHHLNEELFNFANRSTSSP